jgi:hypothetical protein
VVKRIQKLIPSICEICGDSNIAVLHKHHIVERTDPNTSNDDMNLAIVCANCHNKIHAKMIKIIGLYPSTKLPYARTLVYEIDGKSNVPGISDPYYTPVANSMKVHL